MYLRGSCSFNFVCFVYEMLKVNTNFKINCHVKKSGWGGGDISAKGGKESSYIPLLSQCWLKTEIYCCIFVYSVRVWVVYFPFQRFPKRLLLHPVSSVQWRLNPSYSKVREWKGASFKTSDAKNRPTCLRLLFNKRHGYWTYGYY